MNFNKDKSICIMFYSSTTAKTYKEEFSSGISDLGFHGITKANFVKEFSSYEICDYILFFNTYNFNETELTNFFNKFGRHEIFEQSMRRY